MIYKNKHMLISNMAFKKGIGGGKKAKTELFGCQTFILMNSSQAARVYEFRTAHKKKICNSLRNYLKLGDHSC